MTAPKNVLADIAPTGQFHDSAEVVAIAHARGLKHITEGSVIYGSPKTMLDKLVAFRDTAGPFGSLLITGLDWSGANAAWERESMRLLAQEVMPKFRQHAGQDSGVRRQAAAN